MSRRSQYALPLTGSVILWLIGCLGLFAQTSLPANHGQPTHPEIVRELYVPFEDLEALLGEDTERVFMSRDEFEQLKQAARQIPEDQLPTSLALLSANYEAVLSEGRALMQGEMIIEVLQEGLHSLPLAFHGVGLRTAMLDGQPASMGRGAAGETILFISGVGLHQLSVQLVMPIATDAAQQRLDIQVPTAAASRLRFAVPGNVEVKSGAAVMSRRIDAERDLTHFEIILSDAPMSIVMSLNNRKLREQTTLMAHGVTVAEVTQAYERLHATFSMNVLNGATDEFRFGMSDDLEVNNVVCDVMSRWEIQQTNGEKTLVLKLRSPVTDQVVVNVGMERQSPQLTDWHMPSLRALDVAGYTAIVGLVAEDRLQVFNIRTENLFAIDSQVLTAAIPPSMFAVEPGAPRIRPIAAYYSVSADFGLRAEFDLPPPGLVVNASTLLKISDTGAIAAGGFSLAPENESIFHYDFIVPQEWTLEWVSNGEASGLDFNRYAHPDGTRIRVLLPQGVAPKAVSTLWFQARHNPTQWLSDWDAQRLAFPAFRSIGTRVHQGVLAVQVQDDLLANPGAAENLVVLSESEKAQHQLANVPTALAYRYFAVDWSASIDLTRAIPRTTARVYSFFRIEKESIHIHSELVFLLEQARARQLQFSLPDTTPNEVTIRALDGVGIKETASLVREGRRYWSVDLAERKSGTVRLTVDFEQSLNIQESLELALSVIRAEQVEYQTGALSIEGHPELETKITQGPRAVDVGELVEAEYQVGKQLLGAFGYVGSADTIMVSIERRPVHPLPTTIVQRAEIVSAISNEGICQSTGRFSLRTKSNYIEVALPENAKLWSIFLDAKPVLPQRENDRILVAIPASSKSHLRDLQVVYETSSSPVVLQGEIAIASPVLYERLSHEVQGEEIPIADLQWNLWLPSGYRPLTLTSPTAGTSMHWFDRVFDTLWSLGGGRRTSYPLSYVVSTAKTASSSTRESLFDGEDDAAEPLVRQNYSRGDSEEKFSPERASETKSKANGSGMQLNSEAENLSSAPASPPMVQRPSSPKEAAGFGGTAQQASQRSWAMEGVRSLAIDLAIEQSHTQVNVQNLGTDNVARVTLVNQGRFRFIAWTIGLLVFVLGIARKRRASRMAYLFVMTVLALLLPAALGWLVELQGVQRAMLAALLALLVAYMVGTIWNSALARWVEPSISKPSRVTAIAPMLVWIIGAQVAASSAYGQPAAQLNPFGSDSQVTPQIVTNEGQLERLLSKLIAQEAVVIPKDAIVVPYDRDLAVSNQAERVLVPYATYQRLWQLAHPGEQLDAPKPPAAFAWAGATYHTTIDGSQSLILKGNLRLEQFVDGDLAIPMPLSGCVLEKATVNGGPARLQFVQSEASGPAQGNSPGLPRPEDTPLLLLHTSGKGIKEIELLLRWKLTKNGGWRIVEGSVPTAPASALTVSVLPINTELRLSGLSDRSVYFTSQANETVETAVGRDGVFSLQWRDKISEAAVDQGMTVESRAVYDVAEDALRFNWYADLQFRRGRRESLTLLVPANYLIEKVIGSNIRGWTSKRTEQGWQLDVELLKAAIDRESLTVVVSQQVAMGQEEAIEVAVPEIRVPEAMLHQGHFALRRSSLLEIRSGEASGLARMDMPDAASLNLAAENAGPMPLKPYQAYHFSQPGYELKLSARVLPQAKSVEIQSLLKISRRSTTYEGRVVVTATDRPVYQLRIALPRELKLEPPVAPGDFQWKIATQDERQILEIYMANGQSGQFSVLLAGELSVATQSANDAAQVQDVSSPLPSVEVFDTIKQTGTIVVQVDPAFNVRTNNLQGCNLSSEISIRSWTSPEQRTLARAIIAYDAPGYQGDLTVTPRTPVVQCTTVTNVKVTDRAIEETVYLEVDIVQAGISEFTFVLPASLSAARIQAPLLRSVTRTPVNDLPNSAVRVRLELQDAIMGQFAVMVEHDRLPTLGGIQSVPVPRVETGTTKMRMISIENASRDELVTSDTISIERLESKELQKQRQFLALGGKSSIVFRVREDQASIAAPVLNYSAKSRDIVETSGARIGLAQTIMVVDDRGTYRAAQEYRVENRTEPTLEVVMPEGSRLWTVHVAGEPVKPSSVLPGKIRIPLIKTEEGDLDYPVVMKYGGSIARAGSWGEVEFPLIKTVNINVELSQVRLRLPEDFQWFNFGGTLGRVGNEGELEAGWLSFRTRQLSELTELLASSGKMYSKIRAQNNLKQLEQSLQTQSAARSSLAFEEPPVALKKQLDANGFALQQAQQQLREFDAFSQADQVSKDNRDLLGDLYGNQQNGSSLNVVDKLGYNFPRSSAASGLPESELAKSSDENERMSQFDANWLTRNNLANDEAAKVGGSERLQRGQIDFSPTAKALLDESIVPQLQSIFDPGRRDLAETQQPTDQGQMRSQKGSQAELYSQRLQQRGLAPSKNAVNSPTGADRGDLRKRSDDVDGLDYADKAEGMQSDLALGVPIELAEPASGNVPGNVRSDAYMASLDVELPARGQEFLFSTPGGDLSLNARRVSSSALGRAIAVLAILACSFAGFLSIRMVQSMNRNGYQARFVLVTLSGLGLLSLCFGFLPVYGLVSLLGALAILVTKRANAD